MLFKDRGVKVNYERTLQSIDLGKRIATFKTTDGTAELQYDFINVIPPMRAPDSVLNSPLPWKSGPWVAEGWMEVSKGNLRHVRFPNVFGVGDIAGVPRARPPPASNGRCRWPWTTWWPTSPASSPDALYTGYTSCP